MFNTSGSDYLTNVKTAWDNTSKQTRSTIYSGLSLSIVFVILFSMMGITSIANERLSAENLQLKAENQLLQTLIDEQQASADRFDSFARQMISNAEIDVTVAQTESQVAPASRIRSHNWRSWGDGTTRAYGYTCGSANC